MKRYLVERYLPGLTAEAFERARARIAEAVVGSPSVRYLGSTFIPEEESCFCRFEAASLEDVRGACVAAGVPFARIHSTCDFPPERRRKRCAG